MFGNWELVMAAYNAGPGRVRAAVKRAGSSDYWKIARFLPEETRSYVPVSYTHLDVYKRQAL